MKNKQLFSKKAILLFIVAGCLLQTLFQLLSWHFKVLILYDFAIYLVTALFGLMPGLIAALFASILGLMFTNLSVYFLIVTFIVTVIVYHGCQHHHFQTWWTFVIHVILMGVIHGAGCIWLNIHINNGAPIFLWVNDSIINTYLTAIAMSTLNVLICLVLVRLLFMKLPDSFIDRLPFVHWIKEDKNFFTNKVYPTNAEITVRKMAVRTKVISVAVIITVLAGVLLIYTSGRIYQDYSFENYGDIGKKYASVAQNLIDEKELEIILKENGNKTSEYSRLQKNLNGFMEGSDEFITYAYVYQVIPTDGAPKLRVIYDHGSDGDPYGTIISTKGAYYDYERDQLADPSNNMIIGPTVSNGKWGWLLTVYEPIVNDEGNPIAYVGVDLSMNAVVSRIRELMIKIFCLSAIIFIFFIAAIYTCVKYMIVQPVQTLESITNEFRDAEEKKVNTSKEIDSGDEFENLYKSIISTHEVIVADNIKMNEYLATISKLAYRDELTGVKNSTAYVEKIKELDQLIQKEEVEFSVIMVDMNNLKQVNDSFGHDSGNTAIKKMCHTICTIFTHSPVYRIGGDEFVVILENDDYRNRDELVKELSQYAVPRDLKAPAPWEQIALSYGMATYIKKVDQNYRDVFNRADKVMYNVKTELKCSR